MNTQIHIIILSAALALTSHAGAASLTVRAQIDGRSQLVIKPNGLYWHHLLYARPGLHADPGYPTTLNGYSWFPSWPDNVATSPADSAPLDVTATFSANGVALTQDAGRGPVTIIQQPSAQNDYTLILDFDDVAPDGPDFYEVTLTGLSMALLPRLDIRVSQVELCWDTLTNNSYQLQYRSTLTTNIWTPLDGTWVPGSGERYCTTDAVLLGQPQRFYQVLVTNTPPQQ